MRDLINILEASFFTKPQTYSYGHKVRVALGNKKSDTLVKIITSVMQDFNPTEDLEWVQPNPKDPNTIPAGRGDDIITLKRPNGQTFSLVGSGSSIEKLFNHAPGEKGSVAENVGDLSEPVLSAGVVAKLIKRGANSIEDITTDDIKNVLNTALKAEDKTFVVRDLNSKVADNIKFTISLRQPTYEFLMSDRFWQIYDPLLPSVAHFANSGQIDRYADYFYKNGKVDTVWVKSDGLTEQKAKKTDIEAYVKDETGEIRPLKGLNISLKAGSSIIGQVGGGQITNPQAKGYIYGNAMNLFGPFGVKLPQPTEPISSKLSYWVSAYKEAAQQMKAMLAGQNVNQETNFVMNIADYVTKHATSGDPNVKLVSLSKSGISSVHSFKDLQRKLSDNNVNLDVVYREGLSKTGDPRPEIRIYDKTSGKGLVFIRYSSTQDEAKIWNIIDMQDLIKGLTTVTHQKPQPVSNPQQPIQPVVPAQPEEEPVQEHAINPPRQKR